MLLSCMFILNSEFGGICSFVDLNCKVSIHFVTLILLFTNIFLLLVFDFLSLSFFACLLLYLCSRGEINVRTVAQLLASVFSRPY